ncbi:lipopolysaccharide biosynthesis protein [Microvirga sp. KLBC 81]|uniref:Wzz/FepE/Etk N-terminal domain-containing protein n=1 Tax=Microvirga sp. KLBC 81 TaxID=1862707 RepID=UPI000D50A31E|nr:Wzz/FepE/Etk N-terminal domain-containing protein [Microvirga sp. KLBC 81]PVE21801.1 lipopolysaccharide biosynthesis protein [Microvirga sp. KLBC 81]
MYRGIIPGKRSTPIGWPVVDDPPETSEDGPLALARAVIATAKRHKLLMTAWIAICVGLAAFYAHTIPLSYTATATLVLEPQRQSPASGNDAVSAPALDTSRAETELEVIRSERLLANVFESLALATHPELSFQSPGLIGQLHGRIKTMLGMLPTRAPTAEEIRQIAFINFAQRVGVRRIGQAYVVEVSYTSSDPTFARRVANAIVSAYLWQSIAFKSDAAREGGEFIQGRVNALSAQAKAAARAVAAGALPDAPTPDADARVIGAALQPLGPSAPRTGLIIALGGLLGLISGMFAVAFGSVRDRRIRTPESLTNAAGIPCLATVPEASRRKGSTRLSEADMRSLVSSEPESAFAAAIRDLRTSIYLPRTLDRRDGNHTVAFVSCDPQAGCTLLCTNLAYLLYESGSNVMLIDADIHRIGSGLSYQVPLTKASLADMLATGASVDKSTFANLDGITLIPARSHSSRANHLAYLGAPEMARVIDYAQKEGEVLLDLPPLSVGGSAKAGAIHADAIVIVVEAGRTTTDELISAVKALKGVGANVIGAVLNRVNS